MTAISAPDLDNATVDAKAFGMVDERFEQRLIDGATYSVFNLRDALAAPHFGEYRTARIVLRRGMPWKTTPARQ
jgi:hypothetical protein